MSYWLMMSWTSPSVGLRPLKPSEYILQISLVTVTLHLHSSEGQVELLGKYWNNNKQLAQFSPIWGGGGGGHEVTEVRGLEGPWQVAIRSLSWWSDIVNSFILRLHCPASPELKSSRLRLNRTHQKLGGSDQPGLGISSGWADSAGLFLRRNIWKRFSESVKTSLVYC